MTTTTPAAIRNGTRIDEVSDGIFRISTSVPDLPGGFSFNQYLIRDDEPLLFHTGPRALFAQVRDAIAHVLPPQSLRYVSFSHTESDENGALGEFLAIAPHASPLCGRIGAMLTAADLGPRAPIALTDQQTLSLGRHLIRWFDAPHVPHGWDCGFLMEDATRTLLCGDLFTQPGAEHAPLTEGDILEPSEAMRAQMDYFAHGPQTQPVIEKLAAARPRVLACMHGAAWQGDGASMLRELGKRLQD